MLVCQLFPHLDVQNSYSNSWPIFSKHSVDRTRCRSVNHTEGRKIVSFQAIINDRQWERERERERKREGEWKSIVNCALSTSRMGINSIRDVIKCFLAASRNVYWVRWKVRNMKKRVGRAKSIIGWRGTVGGRGRHGEGLGGLDRYRSHLAASPFLFSRGSELNNRGCTDNFTPSGYSIWIF